MNRRTVIARLGAALAALLVPWRSQEAQPEPNIRWAGGKVQSNVCMCLDPMAMAPGASGWEPPACTRCGKPMRTPLLDPWLATNPRWLSSDERIATVDGNGLVTAHRCGIVHVLRYSGAAPGDWKAWELLVEPGAQVRLS